MNNKEKDSDIGVSRLGHMDSSVGKNLEIKEKEGDIGVSCRGQMDNGVGKRGLRRQTSGASILNLSGGSERSSDAVNASRVNALRASVNRHADSIAKVLLSSKDSLEKRSTIESAFRACKDAFTEVSAVLLKLLEERPLSSCISVAEEVRRVVTEVMEEHEGRFVPEARDVRFPAESTPRRVKSYASVVGSGGVEVRVSGGPTVESTNTTSFMIVPDQQHASEYPSAQATREKLCKIFKPSDCGLKVKRISNSLKSAVKIEAFTPDLEKVRSHPGLLAAGLTVQENAKFNPRIIVHGVPRSMSADEIRQEIIAQNFDDVIGNDLKVIYIFPPKQDKRFTSCVLEISPSIRTALLKNGRIFLRYAACNFADHIRVMQCYRCLKFGHLAKNCKEKPCCGHCAEGHEMKDCVARNLPPVCINCKHTQGANYRHMATDGKLCPILCRKIKDKIANTNYG